MEILEEASEKECIYDRNWFQCPTQPLVSNGIHPLVFFKSNSQLAHQWERKDRNIIITCSANWGKTFLLRRIEDIFQIISNPASDKQGWVGAEKAEVMLLNDFCWTSDLIKQNNFPLLLEGHKVNLFDPKKKIHFRFCLFKRHPHIYYQQTIYSVYCQI